MRSGSIALTCALLAGLSAGACTSSTTVASERASVAILSSGGLTAREALGVLAALRTSELYRADQNSYLLYPDRRLPALADKGRISPAAVERSTLLRTMTAAGAEEIVRRDVDGVVRFRAELRNGRLLGEALELLASGPHAELVAAERESVLALYESVFDHRSFTGRSGTFFGYEGLGCTYWHQVSKLALAVQEVFQDAVRGGEPSELLSELEERYFEIRAGLGTDKSPADYGAFPTDPYSHTPAHRGVQQPGLTGQVKEDFLARMGELGVWVEGGRAGFRPLLLRENERRTEPGTFEYLDVDGEAHSLEVPAGGVAFTYCQVPVVLHAASGESLRWTRADGEIVEIVGSELDAGVSSEVFRRTGLVRRIDVLSSVGPVLGSSA
ncbi:MAG: hypothetical protein GY711_00225 [bacterium]|nr:hypothetical protein [bacterium]